MRSMWGAAFALLKQGGQLIVIKSLDHNGFQAGKMAGLYNGISRIGSLAGIVAGVILTPLIGLITVFYVFFFMHPRSCAVIGNPFLNDQLNRKQSLVYSEIIACSIRCR